MKIQRPRGEILHALHLCVLHQDKRHAGQPLDALVRSADAKANARRRQVDLLAPQAANGIDQQHPPVRFYHLTNGSDGVQQTGRCLMMDQTHHLDGGILTQRAIDPLQVGRTRPGKGQLHDIKTMNRCHLGHARAVDTVVDDQHLALGMQ
jgi:hypothetical protein